MRAKEIDKNTWLITRGNGRTSIHNYLLVGEEKAALIDTGLETEELRVFVSQLTEKQIVVIHTHGHIDHIGNDSQFDEVMLHPADFKLYRLHSSMEFRKNYFDVQYKEVLQKKPDKVNAFKVSHPLIINQNIDLKPLVEGMVIDLGERSLKVIETPGHTGGCVSLLEEERKTIYTGDMICEMGVLMHFPESTSINRYKLRLKVIQARITSEYRLYVGHQLAPLKFEWIVKYIDCANELIEFGQAELKNNPENLTLNELLVHSKRNTEISYTNQKLIVSS